MPTCVSLLEEFIRRSDGMIVLLSWHYFERLWVERCESSPHDGPMHPRRNSPVRAVHAQCVYEWAAFLIHHKPMDISICVEAFMLPGTVPIYVDSIEKLSVKSCECYNEGDRETLRIKVRARVACGAAGGHESGLIIEACLP